MRNQTRRSESGRFPARTSFGMVTSQACGTDRRARATPATGPFLCAKDGPTRGAAPGRQRADDADWRRCGSNTQPTKSSCRNTATKPRLTERAAGARHGGTQARGTNREKEVGRSVGRCPALSACVQLRPAALSGQIMRPVPSAEPDGASPWRSPKPSRSAGPSPPPRQGRQSATRSAGPRASGHSARPARTDPGN